MGLSGLTRLATALCVLPSLLLIAPTAAAGTRFALRPIELLGYEPSFEGDALRLSVDLPCGGELVGIVASTAPGKTLRLAALAKQNSIVCTALPGPLIVVIDYLDARAYETIAPLAVREGTQRIVVNEIQDLRANTPEGPMATYESSCGDHVGFLVTGTGRTSSLGVAVVDQISQAQQAVSRETGATCRSKLTTVALRAVRKDMRKRLRAAHDLVSDDGRKFELRLAPVVSGSVANRDGGGLELAYMRQCNEAPVGIVFGKAKARGQARIGMLVARYVNVRCAEGSAALNREAAFDRALHLPEAARVVLMKPAGLGDGMTIAAERAPWELQRPVAITRVQREGGNGIVIDYLASCRTPIGAVYARDTRGKLAVGILRAAVGSAGASSCKKKPTEVSWSQPYLARDVRAQDLHPLRMAH